MRFAAARASRAVLCSPFSDSDLVDTEGIAGVRVAAPEPRAEPPLPLGGGADTAAIGPGWTNLGPDGMGNVLYEQVVGIETASLVVDDDIFVDVT